MDKEKGEENMLQLKNTKVNKRSSVSDPSLSDKQSWDKIRLESNNPDHGIWQSRDGNYTIKKVVTYRPRYYGKIWTPLLDAKSLNEAMEICKAHADRVEELDTNNNEGDEHGEDEEIDY